VRLIQLADVGDGEYRDRSSRYMTKAAAKRLNCSYLEAGDILVARMPDPLGRCCRFPGDPKPAVTVVDVCILRPNVTFFDPDFLVVAINCPRFRRLVSEQATGTTRSRISRSNLGVLPIPLPPLAEQKRIVAKVDELMALCDRLEAQQQERDVRQAALARASLARFADAPTPANLQFLFHPSYAIPPADIRKSILTLAVQGKLVPQDQNDEAAEVTFRGLKTLAPDSGDGSDLPGRWVLCPYRNLTTLVTSGSRGWKEFYAQTGAIFIRTQNIKTDKLVLEDVAFVDLPKSAEGTRSQVLKDDILITITGANVTKAARVEAQIPEAYVSQHIALTRPRWSEMSQWIHLCFVSHGSARGTLEKLAYGDKPGLNLNNIRDLALPIPPLREQRRIVAKVDQLMALVDKLEAQLSAARATGADLMEAVAAELTAEA
jgi:type I restriction enzyme S subunit